MRLKFWGTRGGHPTDQQMVSVQIQTDFADILVDVGSSDIFTDLAQVCSLDGIFLTHLHSDHTAMLPHIVLARLKLLGSDYKAELCPIYAPENVRSIMASLGLPKAAYRWSSRIPGEVADLHIRATHTKHSRPAYAYRFAHPDSGSVVLTGDAIYTNELARFCADAEVLVCECNNSDENTAIAEKWMHMTPRDVATLLGQSRPKHTVLYHFGDLSPDQALQAVGNLLDDDTMLVSAASDGFEIEL